MIGKFSCIIDINHITRPYIIYYRINMSNYIFIPLTCLKSNVQILLGKIHWLNSCKAIKRQYQC